MQAELSVASTAYRWDGPADGRVLLLVHGATVPGWQFDYLVPHLTAAGIRCLRIDLYGHGDSARPAVRYTLDLFVRQTLELVERLGVAGPIAALGHSMGATVVAAMAARRRSLFRRLVMVAPMLDFTANSPASVLLQVPLLGEVLMRVYVVPMLMLRRRRRYAAIGDGSLYPRFIEQVRRPGYHRALLSMFRCGTLGNQAAVYADLGRAAPPTRLLWGDADPVATAQQMQRICTLLGNLPLRRFAGLGHNLLMTHPHEAAGDIIEWVLSDAPTTGTPDSG